MSPTSLTRFTVTVRGHVFTITARSAQAVAEALDTIQAYALTLSLQ